MKIKDATAVGCCLATGLSIGLWKTIEELKKLILIDQHFEYHANEYDNYNRRYQNWHSAVQKLMGSIYPL